MTIITKKTGNREMLFSEERLRGFIQNKIGVDDKEYEEEVIRGIISHESFKADSITDLMINVAMANLDETSTHWTFVAAKIYLLKTYREASKNRSYDAKEKYGDFYGLLKVLAGRGIYTPDILEKYTSDEIKELSKLIDPSKDLLFTYPGLQALKTRYLAVDHDKNVFELPQERWLIIAMDLHQDEDASKRDFLIGEAYWAMSNLFMTVATPTLSNTGKTTGQRSSCFIDTVDDSLEGIYDSNTDIAQLSKGGGGIGVYMGKVRSRGSAIQGFKGASSGILPWIKQLNNTAVSVDQLGQRPGAIAIYLDVWHKDILGFLDLKLNNGDPRLRAHDIFTGLCLPDIFMETLDKRADWYTFDPHEVRQVMGYSLEDFYDETKGKGSFRDKYEECVQCNELTKTKIPAIDIMKRVMRSQLETGTPYMFYRDEVNRKNPNPHKGMIYSSNLCTEIMQNMSPSVRVKYKFDGVMDEDIIATFRKAGDFVVCNLSSINLGKAVPAKVLERLIKIQVRMLDNVVDLNSLPVEQAERTNQRYRGIGLGTFGWHHLLALENIQWETDEAVAYADELYERINYLSIKASMELAIEKGAYPLFEGSDWHTGEYFEKRNYESDEWKELRASVNQYGMRNGYLMAVAPNASTSVIAGSTPSIDPIFKPFYYEEKKDSKLPVVAPDLNHKTYDVYRKSAYILDQRWSIMQNAARQRHIDQAISFNMYVPNNIPATMLLELHMQAWKSEMKTTYYTRSTASDIQECEWCHS